MKKIFVLLLMIGSLGIYSCEDYFLQKPDTSGTVNLEAIYGSSKNATAALMNCYHYSLLHGWPGGWGVGHGALASISGERSRGYSWHGTYQIVSSGLSVNGSEGSDGGADSYASSWANIRNCFVTKENIDKVPDMTDAMKGYIKAECTGLIAYRYMGMFYRYGGLPIVTKSFDATDEMTIQRSSLQATLDYVLSLCDEAIAGLPEGDWSEDQTGRLTKGAVMAMKAKVLMFAARPLFNASTPYLDNGVNNNLICFGSENSQRWQDAITANEAVLTWAAANGYALNNTGGAGEGQPNPNALADYGNATSTPGNREVLLALKWDDAGQGGWSDYAIFYFNNTSNLWTNSRYDTDQVGLLSNFLENYYRKDGTDQSWPKIGDAEPRPISDWIERIENMEPRFRADNLTPGVQTVSNPGIKGWTIETWNRTLGNSGNNDIYPSIYGDGRGCASTTKFYFNAGTRTWFEAPLFRLAETYLNLAEAYNEAGNTTLALRNLNIVHNRAGLPAVVITEKSALRSIIQREKAVEYYNENHRYFDVKHWKLDNIGNGIIGGQMREMQFRATTGLDANLPTSLIEYWDGNVYVTYWNPKMFLEPFPQSEINKGTVIQNPGY